MVIFEKVASVGPLAALSRVIISCIPRKIVKTLDLRGSLQIITYEDLLRSGYRTDFTGKPEKLDSNPDKVNTEKVNFRAK